MAQTSTSNHVPQQPKPPDPASEPASNVVRQTMSFAAAVSKSKTLARYPDVPLPARQYGSKDGVPSITFSATEHQALTQRIRHSVVAKFQAVRPPLAAIKAHVQANWKLKGTVSMSPNWDGRHMVFFLDSEEYVNAALVCPSRKVQHTYFRLFRWTPDYNPKKEATKVTKWIKLPGLPMEFFTRSCLKAIVSSFAYFLDIDDRTYNMNSLHCARACVELDVTNTVPSKVWIACGDMSFYQDIVVEGGISYCMKCRIHGHDISHCKKIKPADPVAAKDDGNVKGKESISRNDNTTQPKILENEWVLAKSKRRAVRSEPPVKEMGKRVEVSSKGLIDLQDSIDNCLALPPHKPMQTVTDKEKVDNDNIGSLIVANQHDMIDAATVTMKAGTDNEKVTGSGLDMDNEKEDGSNTDHSPDRDVSDHVHDLNEVKETNHGNESSNNQSSTEIRELRKPPNLLIPKDPKSTIPTAGTVSVLMSHRAALTTEIKESGRISKAIEDVTSSSSPDV